MRTGPENPKPPHPGDIRSGGAVWIIEKKNYGTRNYTQGIVAEVLSPGAVHPRGIKVRLTDGTVGRVQWLVE